MDKFILDKNRTVSLNNLCSNSSNVVALLNVYKEKEEEGNTVWRGSSSEGHNFFTSTYCREVFYSNHTGMLHRKGLLLKDGKLATVTSVYNEEKYKVAVKVLNILEKRYKWTKTTLVMPEIELAGTQKESTYPKVIRKIVIFNSPEMWLINSVISSIYTLYIRLALATNVYDTVENYSDIKKVNKKIIMESRVNKNKPSIFDIPKFTVLNATWEKNDFSFIIKTTLIWDFFIKNMRELMHDEIDVRLNGSYGIDRLVYGTIEGTNNDNWKTFKDKVEYPKIKSFLLEQKLVMYRGIK